MTKSNAPNDDIKQKAKSAAEDLGSSARDTAQDAASAVREEAMRRADSAKSGVADEVSDVASGLRKAAEDMRSGSPQERTIGQIAGGLADMSEAIRDKDLGEMAGELSDFAKRNPLLFIGGIALAGFAATRFATASARRDDRGNTQDGDDRAPYSARNTAQADVQTASGVHARTRPGGAAGTPATPRTPGTAGGTS
ncbi:hypothetical protein DC366_06240 [Pelagivirga sediminicola]|uniref:Uncharacterized protein n=1 Tax=Pelagivirga sediminicola TaxID=2170575 RepID=A0A2T7GA89_9RHOB|nr:hypothetical protein [Pelagivirga sediminicola]PVA11334.1 hypothetical protein DC366_06240 [Pelagivirga sediminicola]